MKTKLSKILFFLLFISTTNLYPQVVGVGLESSYYYVSKELFFKFLKDPIINMLLNYDHNIDSTFQISINIGYGLSNHQYIIYQPTDGGAADNFNKVSTKGIPISIEFRFTQLITKSNLIEPFVGLGISYCNYETKVEDGSKYYNYLEQSTLSTKGFSQYFSLGANFYISRNIIGYVHLKKMVLSSIKTKGGSNFLGYSAGSKFEEDYSIAKGLEGLGITFGLGFEL